jgi:S-DNA-T family DNA segregation ATPase FtsK/SpoIIIE
LRSTTEPAHHDPADESADSPRNHTFEQAHIRHHGTYRPLNHIQTLRLEHDAPATLYLLACARLAYLLALRLVLGAERHAVWQTRRRIKRTWPRTARRLGLTVEETVSAWLASPGTSASRRVLVPGIRAKREPWGVRIELRTIEGVGLAEIEKAADHLADVWRVPIVRVEQHKPGTVTVRALLWDPLTTEIGSASATSDGGGAQQAVSSWLVGTDQDGTAATVKTSDVSGIVVAGLAGYGKTNLLDNRFAALAPSPHVQFAVIDGKGGPDWDCHAPRCFAFAKDDPAKTHEILSHLHNLLAARQHLIRNRLGVKNLWEAGPSRTWPLVVLIVDEAHTFFYETKGADADSKQRDRIARESARMIEELVRKGRNVGIQVILATQKATGDAIPTRIRDNCQVAISFAQRTSEAAIAILGTDITQYPDAHPRRLQNPDYVGVATLVADGRPGYTLIRTPKAALDQDIQRLARQTANLTADPLTLLGSAEPGSSSVLIIRDRKAA